MDDMQVDGTAVYYVDATGGTVNSMPSAGGAVTVLASGLAKPVHLALDAQYVYFSDNLGGAVMRVPKTGGTPQTISATTEPRMLAVDAQNVYWVDDLHTNVWVAPKAGGTASVLASFPSSALSNTLLAQNTLSVFALRTYPYPVVPVAIAKAGGAVTPLSGVPGAFAVNDTNFYWSSNDSNSFWINVATAPLASPQQQQILLANAMIQSNGPYGITPAAIVPDTQYLVLLSLYKSNIYDTEGGIVTLDYCMNAAPKTVLDFTWAGQSFTALLAVDSSYIYWYENSMLGRVAKP
jgi:hypothetical protein